MDIAQSIRIHERNLRALRKQNRQDKWYKAACLVLIPLIIAHLV
jgi:hypothetical protein